MLGVGGGGGEGGSTKQIQGNLGPKSFREHQLDKVFLSHRARRGRVRGGDVKQQVKKLVAVSYFILFFK